MLMLLSKINESFFQKSTLRLSWVLLTIKKKRILSALLFHIEEWKGTLRQQWQDTQVSLTNDHAKW